MFEAVEQRVRENLAPLRAATWKGGLSDGHFLDRNRRLEAHSFAKRIQTGVWRDERGEIVSSFDCLALNVLLAEPGRPVRREPIGLIASVLTPNEYRGRGYASRMLGAYFDAKRVQNFVLYSDIGAPFYERFGFSVFPREERSIAPSAERDVLAGELEVGAFAARIDEKRRTLLASAPSARAMLSPDPEWIDWVRERYRAAAESVGEIASEGGYWEVSHANESHVLCGFAHFAKRTFDLLWWEQGCEDCLDFARARAAQTGKLKSVTYWAEPSGRGKTEYPMIKIPGMRPHLHDVQLGDWW